MDFTTEFFGLDVYSKTIFVAYCWWRT